MRAAPGGDHGTAEQVAWLILGEAHLRAVLAEYQAYYNSARPRQGIAQRTPDDHPHASPGTAADLAGSDENPS